MQMIKNQSIEDRVVVLILIEVSQKLLEKGKRLILDI